MRQWTRTTLKWILRGVVFLLVLAALDVAVLAFPHPLFEHKQRFDGFTVYSDLPIPDHYGEVIEDARARIEAMDYVRPDANYDVFICDEPWRYSLFAFLTRRTSNSLAIGLSAFDHIFVNNLKVQRFAAQNYGGIRHSRYEGNTAEVIAHEIAHFKMLKQLGVWTALNLPLWKSEGMAEYLANLAATRADESYDFTERVDLLMNIEFWGSEHSFARQMFESHLLIEFLAEEQGLSLNDLANPKVTDDLARDQMLAWYR
jgi:hypothetical protein